MLSSLSKIDPTKGHHRVKSSACKNYKDSHPLLLMNKGIEYKHRLDEKVAKHTEQELKACTFWPKVNKPTIKYSNSKMVRSSSKNSNYISAYKDYLDEENENSLKMIKNVEDNSQTRNKYAQLKSNESDDFVKIEKDEGKFTIKLVPHVEFIIKILLLL